MANSIHVVHVLGELQPSGMERMLASASSDWPKQAVRISIFSQGSETPYGELLSNLNYRVHYLPNIKSPLGMLRIFRKYREIRPDAIHLHAESAHGLHALIARISSPNAHVIRTIHNVFHRTGIKRIARRIQLSISLACGVTHVSPSLDVSENEMSNWGLKTLVIENWVDSEFSTFPLSVRASGPSESLRRVALVGNCSWQKNHEVVLRLLGNANGLRIVHAGSEASASTEESILLQELERDDKIERLGSTSQIASALSGAHAFCMPSRTEGMPVALLEAICVGLPSWVADVPGLAWAGELPGVRLVSNGEWLTALHEIASEAYEHCSDEAREFQTTAQWRFSSARGAEQYARLYYTPVSGRISAKKIFG